MAQTNWDSMIEIDQAFLEKVYAEVAKIPAGKVSTYGKIAELAGYPKASREVGIAMSRVPGESGLPCHRVVNKKGTLAPGYVFGSQERQRELLLVEGVTFLPDNSIDLEKHMWPECLKNEQLSLFEM